MKTLFFVASFATALIAFPASAQLGPAGVPGAPGLAETDPSVKSGPPAPVAPPATQTQPRNPVAADCSKAKNVKQCKARQEARKKALNADCAKSADPVRCEQHKKTRTLCKDKPDQEYRQCLRDNLAPKK